MLPRLCPSLLYLLLLLVTLWTGVTANELTVDLTDDEARNKEYKKATPVCQVKFILPANHSITVTQGPSATCVAGSMVEECTVHRDSETDVINIVATSQQDSSVTFTFNITFNSSREVGCRTYLPHLRYYVRDPVRHLITCDPVLACNATSTNISNTTWWRLETEDQLLNFTSSLNKAEWKPISSDNNTLEVEFLNGKQLNVVGYYATTFEIDGINNIMSEDYFIIYLNPEEVSTSGDEEVVFGKDKARNFMGIYCKAESFPFTTATWESPSKSNFTVTDAGSVKFNIEKPEADVTLGGRLVFDKVQFEDHGDYRCTVRHPISGVEVSASLRFRVRHYLRPLWPALGILGSIGITILFIAGGAAVDKIRGNRSTDDDEGSFQRNYSIVSNLGDEGGEGRQHTRKHQAAGKRISITQQELLSDTN